MDKNIPARVRIKKRRPTTRVIRAAQGDSRYSLALEYILGADRKSDRWLAMFASQGWLTEGLRHEQRYALFLIAVWRLALACARQVAREKSPGAALAIGHDLHSWIAVNGGAMQLDRLDCERMAADAWNIRRQESFKRKKAMHG